MRDLRRAFRRRLRGATLGGLSLLLLAGPGHAETAEIEVFVRAGCPTAPKRTASSSGDG